MDWSTSVVAFGELSCALGGELVRTSEESMDLRFRLASAARKYSAAPGDTGSSDEVRVARDCSLSLGLQSGMDATPCAFQSVNEGEPNTDIHKPRQSAFPVSADRD